MNPRDHYKILGKVGEGGYAKILKCQRLSDNQEVVLKHTGNSDVQKSSVIKECKLLSALKSENIVNCEEVLEFEGRIWVFLEYMEGGDLSKIVLNSDLAYSEEFCKYTLLMVARGLSTMHTNNVLHRDMKADNILCRPNG